jgi:hypothetical protein
LALVCLSTSAKAEPATWHLGAGMDLGAPSGLSVGVVFNPWVDWVQLQASLSDNVLHLGGRGSLQLDPMALMTNVPIGLFGDLQVGGFPKGNIPGHSSDLPTIGYTYENLFLGLRLGKPNGFHWNFEGGFVHLNVDAGNFQSIVNQSGGTSGLTIGDPKISGWIVPGFSTGFTVVW